MKLATCAALLATLLTAATATAQSNARFYVTINGGAQPASPALSEHFTFERNVEEATADVRYPSRTGVLVDGGGGYRMWRQLGVGLSVSYASSSGTANIDASIPHPFVFGRPRTIDGSQGAMSRNETGAHLQVLYFIPARGKLRVILAGGPSFISLSQDAVTEVHYSESYPYDTATFTRADTTQAKASSVGFNAGADIRWMFGKSFGLGGLVRYTRATIDLDTTEDRSLSVDAGGFQAGAGIRVHF